MLGGVSNCVLLKEHTCVSSFSVYGGSYANLRFRVCEIFGGQSTASVAHPTEYEAVMGYLLYESLHLLMLVAYGCTAFCSCLYAMSGKIRCWTISLKLRCRACFVKRQNMVPGRAVAFPHDLSSGPGFATV